MLLRRMFVWARHENPTMGIGITKARAAANEATSCIALATQACALRIDDANSQNHRLSTCNCAIVSVAASERTSSEINRRLAAAAHWSPTARYELPGSFLSHPVVEVGGQVGHVPQASAEGTDFL